MPRNLTGKQAKFALGAAMGKSQVDSYREAYEPSALYQHALAVGLQLTVVG